MKNNLDNVAGQPVDASGPAVVKTREASTTPILADDELKNKRAGMLAQVYLYLLSGAWGKVEIQKEKELM